MKKTIKILLVCFIVPLVGYIGLWSFFRFVVGPATGFDHKFHNSFSTVENGMERTDVIKILGKPESQNKEFRLGQRTGFEDEYGRASKSGSEYYLFWHNGIDIVYTIGFDKNDAVTIKAYGGT